MSNESFSNDDAMNEFFTNEIDHISELLKILSNPLRLKILSLLFNKPTMFNDLLEETNVQKSVLGNHLSTLREKYLIKKIDRGFYKITDDGKEILKHLSIAFLNIRLNEQERLERKMFTYERILSKYTNKVESKEIVNNEIDRKEGNLMNIETVNREAFILVGLTSRGTEPKDFIFPLWETFLKRFNELDGKIKSSAKYGVSYDINKETREFSYFIGSELGKNKEIPDNMLTFKLPAREYVVVECSLNTLQNGWKAASKWIKEHGYRDISPPEFEFYPEDHETDDDLLYIYVPFVKN